MAVRNSQIVNYGAFPKGLLLRSDNPFLGGSGALLRSKNAFYRDGLVKRSGMLKLSTSQVNGSNSITLHTYSRDGEISELLAASGGKILKSVIGKTWSDVKTGLDPNSQVFFTNYSPDNKVLIANGTNTPLIWDGVSIADYTAAPAGAKKFTIHRDRVFTYSNGLDIKYSNNLDINTWTSPALTLTSDDARITAMIQYSQNVSDNSILSQLLVFTANTIWVITGNDFTNLTDIYLHQATGFIGTLSPKTIIKTPKGIMFLGREEGKNRLVIINGQGIGLSIQTDDSIRNELDKIPESALEHAVAVYRDGFFRLLVRDIGGITNTREWWFEINSGSWFGEMDKTVGMYSFVKYNKNIYSGGEDGNVYVMDTSENDNGTDIDVSVQTVFSALDIPYKEKRIEKVLFTLQLDKGYVTIKAVADSQESSDDITASTILSITETGTLFPYTFPITFQENDIQTIIKTIDFLNADNDVFGTNISFKINATNLGKYFSIQDFNVIYSPEDGIKQED